MNTALYHGLSLQEIIRLPLQPSVIIHRHPAQMCTGVHSPFHLLYYMSQFMPKMSLLPRPDINIAAPGIRKCCELSRLLGMIMHLHIIKRETGFLLGLFLHGIRDACPVQFPSGLFFLYGFILIHSSSPSIYTTTFACPGSATETIPAPKAHTIFESLHRQGIPPAIGITPGWTHVPAG